MAPEQLTEVQLPDQHIVDQPPYCAPHHSATQRPLGGGNRRNEGSSERYEKPLTRLTPPWRLGSVHHGGVALIEPRVRDTGCPAEPAVALGRVATNQGTWTVRPKASRPGCNWGTLATC